MQLLIGMIVNVHLGSPFQLVHLAFYILVLQFGSLVVETCIYLVVCLRIKPVVFVKQPFNELVQLRDLPL